jgi:hypothetical protein
MKSASSSKARVKNATEGKNFPAVRVIVRFWTKSSPVLLKQGPRPETGDDKIADAGKVSG